MRQLILIICLLAFLLSSCDLPDERVSDAGSQGITGRVILDEGGDPVPDALVTIRASEYQINTDDEGFFELLVSDLEGEVEVTAWAPGYYIAYTHAEVPSSDVILELRPYHTEDHPDYEWLDPTPSEEVSAACGNCHPMILPQWQNNAHGGAIENARFYSFYNGTDISGSTVVEPGYTLDFPGTTGNCAACHAPGAAVDSPFTTDMNAVRSELTAGIHCDFCHKIGGVFHSPASDSPYNNMPGIFSMKVLRPPEGEQIFIGPYPDIHDPDTYLPLMDESAFCAPCHQFSFWGTSIYNSYGEWLDSPYSDPETGRTCQDCHMPPNGDEYFASIEQGGLAHPPETIPSHFQVGISDETLMQNSVEMEVSAEQVGDEIHVQVTLTNTEVGHHIPTDHPGRHMLLLVEALDENGDSLTLLEGSTISAWGGDFAGFPGMGYAKILQDVETGEFPVVSYWKQALIVSDNRLAAFESDTTTYIFKTSEVFAEHSEQGEGEETSEVSVRLLFRRLYQPIAERYGWEVGELVMESETVQIGGAP